MPGTGSPRKMRREGTTDMATRSTARHRKAQQSAGAERRRGKTELVGAERCTAAPSEAQHRRREAQGEDRTTRGKALRGQAQHSKAQAPKGAGEGPNVADRSAARHRAAPHSTAQAPRGARGRVNRCSAGPGSARPSKPQRRRREAQGEDRTGQGIAQPCGALHSTGPNRGTCRPSKNGASHDQTTDQGNAGRPAGV